MAYFDEDFLKFFKELAESNSKEWFDLNRKRYLKSVKEPFKSFTLELINALQSLYPKIDLSSKYSIMRINRDVRFTKDKTPYKTHMSAIVLPHGKKDKSRPGFYIQASHKDVRVYSGAHNLEKEQLFAIRNYITENIHEFNTLIKEKSFVETFGEIQGDKHKRIPPEFREAASIQPLIRNKEFYWYFKLKAEELLEDNLIDVLIDRYTNCLPVNAFFKKTLS
ncbi:TIGR02453 family protein [Muricauda sp. JGD-17]|uniref:TIGR02453 family protein n=1 Tax=Flagellimonas ochracea TaxID=2696472 RepID=A0A964TFA3_9FLAO|nr:DUF2461 domain-containing protein [Allomuricauda ochracea]NAY93389.1 TIGR02453 family protein [Allomuricauda ochracea]